MKSCLHSVTRRSSVVCITAAALLSLSTSTLAEDSGKLTSDQLFAAKLNGDAYSVSVSNAPHVAQSMRVTGPRGFKAESRSLTVSSSKPLPDGSYNYEITGALSRSDAVFDPSSNRENGRSEDATPTRQPTGVIASGHFKIVNGAIFEPGNETEERESDSRPQRSAVHEHGLRDGEMSQ